MPHLPLPLAAAAATLALNLAAQHVVVPAGLELREGNALSGHIFESTLGRHQVVIARAHLTALGTPWQVSEVWFRRDMGRAIPLVGGTIDLEVWAGNTSAPAEGPEPRFDSNRGNDFARVFQAVITLPDAPIATATPAPWAVPFAIRIPFTSPVIDHGGNLLLEFVSRKVSGQTPPQSWVVDSEDMPAGTAPIDFGQGCSPTPPQPEGSIQGNVRPGLTTVFQLFGGRKGTPYIHALGFSDQLLMGYPILPLSLDTQGAPGCALYVDLQSLTAGLSTSDPKLWFGTGRVSLRWPLDTGLIGAVGFSQWLLWEPSANPLGLTTTNATRFQLAGLAQTGMALVSAEDLAATSGRVQTHHLPVLRIVP